MKGRSDTTHISPWHYKDTLVDLVKLYMELLNLLNPTNLSNIGGESQLSEDEVDSPLIPSSSYPSKTINQTTKFKIIPVIPSLPHPIPYISLKALFASLEGKREEGFGKKE